MESRVSPFNLTNQISENVLYFLVATTPGPPFKVYKGKKPPGILEHRTSLQQLATANFPAMTADTESCLGLNHLTQQGWFGQVSTCREESLPQKALKWVRTMH